MSNEEREGEEFRDSEDEMRLLLVLLQLLGCGLKMAKARWGGRSDGGTRINDGATEEEEAKRKSCGIRRSRGREV